MRTLDTEKIAQALETMCQQACRELPADVGAAMERACAREPFAPAKEILQQLLKNAAAAKEDRVPICQDTGMAWVWLEIGQDVFLTGAPLKTAVDQGIRRGYQKGYLRKSVVKDPLIRENTLDNTPALLTVDIVPGDTVKISLCAKGFGSENMSRLRMLPPAAGAEGVKAFVVDTVRLAGGNPCPPVVVGVGIGGSFDKVALLAKQALLLPLDQPNPTLLYADMEQDLLERINALGIGPEGFGGKTTALAVKIKTMPTHIAGLPVAVNLNCHVARHQEVVL